MPGTPLLALGDNIGSLVEPFLSHVLLAWLAASLVLGVSVVVFYLFSLPLRRAERSTLFLNIIETGLKDGHSLEKTVIELSRLRGFSLGSKFHRLAAHIANGKSFGEALDLEPRFLPAQLAGTLKAGLKLGDVAKVLPACRRLMADAMSKTQAAEGYLLLLQSLLLPVLPAVLSALWVFVIPKFVEIARDMGIAPTGWSRLVIENATTLVLISSCLTSLAWCLVFCFMRGPHASSWKPAAWIRFSDTWIARIPWVWKRLQRDFTTLLAIFLDAGVPESEAIQMAASATGNQAFVGRAGKAVEGLRQGEKFALAARYLDDSGELQWRLANAAQGNGQFLRALEGWHEALDAQAYRLEQTASHLLTTVLVVINGVMVGLVVAALFGLLLAFIQEGLLW